MSLEHGFDLQCVPRSRHQFLDCPPTPAHSNAMTVEAYEQSNIVYNYPSFIEDPSGSCLDKLSLKSLSAAFTRLASPNERLVDDEMELV